MLKSFEKVQSVLPKGERNSMKGLIYYNGDFVGILEKNVVGNYVFQYDPVYYNNPELPPICLGLPKTKQLYYSPNLFPFFVGLLAEGINKDLQCHHLNIDEKDAFSRLLLTAADPRLVIGAVTVRPVNVINQG